MHFLKYLFICFSIFFLSTVWADTATTLPAKLNYTIIDPSKLPKDFTVPAHQILVYDFFSYGCPHCYHLSPSLQQWQIQNADKIISEKKSNAKKISKRKNTPYIIFQSVPVTFDPGWDTLSKAYHIADLLGVEKTLHNQIFDITQNPLLGLNSDAQLRSFFLNQGVSATDYDRVAKSDELSKAIQNDQALMKTFNIMEIPVVVVADGKNVYYISNQTVANADPTLFANTLTALTAKRPA